MGGGLTFVYITGSCNCGREWRGTRPIADRSCIKFDVTKYTIASDLWRQPPSFYILLTHACLLVCHIYLLFLSALLVFTPYQCRLLSSPVWCKDMDSCKAVNFYEQQGSSFFSLSATIKSRYFTGIFWYTLVLLVDWSIFSMCIKGILMQTWLMIWFSCWGARWLGSGIDVDGTRNLSSP